MKKNNLNELFSKYSKDNEDIDSNFKSLSNKRVLMFDAHNLAFRTLFSAIFTNPEDNNSFQFWKYVFMNSLLSTINFFKPYKVILAFDSKLPNWRYSIFPDYKANRKIAREKTIVDFDKFFSIFEQFKIQIRETFTKIYVIEIANCEADDIIATLCKEKIFENDEVIIISSDSDFNQLITTNVKQYDPINKKMFNCLNPNQDLIIKILTGDKSDNIPPVKKHIGIVTAEKILKNGIDNFLKENDEIMSNFIRNKTLIDLNYIPLEIKKNIINKYNEYQLKDMESKKILDFFTQNRLIKLMQTWNSFSDDIRRLN